MCRFAFHDQPCAQCRLRHAGSTKKSASAGSVVASNERSASYGNVVYQGVEVNHQWSKGLRFEQLLGAWCDRHLPEGARWLSLLPVPTSTPFPLRALSS